MLVCLSINRRCTQFVGKAKEDGMKYEINKAYHNEGYEGTEPCV